MRNKMDAEADKWFYDLGAMATKIEATQKKTRLLVLRFAVLTLIVLIGLSYALYRIDSNVRHIEENRRDSCAGGLIILEKFNNLQEELAITEALNDKADPVIRDRRVKAYREAKILPLPVCES